MCKVFSGGSVVKNPPANEEDTEDAGSIPESGRSSGGGDGNLLQYSCLENPTDRGIRRAIIHGVAKSRTWLSMHTLHIVYERTQKLRQMPKMRILHSLKEIGVNLVNIWNEFGFVVAIVTLWYVIVNIPQIWNSPNGELDFHCSVFSARPGELEGCFLFPCSTLRLQQVL